MKSLIELELWLGQDSREIPSLAEWWGTHGPTDLAAASWFNPDPEIARSWPGLARNSAKHSRCRDNKENTDADVVRVCKNNEDQLHCSTAATNSTAHGTPILHLNLAPITNLIRTPFRTFFVLTNIPFIIRPNITTPSCAMSVRVVARIRPLLDKESSSDIIVHADCIAEGKPLTVVKIPNPKNEAEEFSFSFNSVYTVETTQEELFKAEGSSVLSQHPIAPLMMNNVKSHRISNPSSPAST